MASPNCTRKNSILAHFRQKPPKILTVANGFQIAVVLDADQVQDAFESDRAVQLGIAGQVNFPQAATGVETLGLVTACRLLRKLLCPRPAAGSSTVAVSAGDGSEG